ncbi:MAG: peptidyl-prolyl cis-trans isomerase [Candidatus Aminicenantes bacterium]|nr:peptidyl-prolyl cis-trans isomerase [Candidatus Aminicenantes bacterium]
MIKYLILTLAILSFLVPLSSEGLAQENTIEVIMKTSKGDIVIELYPEKTPLTVENFLTYVDEKFYDGTIFHRVIKGFMIQGGGWTTDFTQKAAYEPIRNEAETGLNNRKYTIALGRRSDPHSAAAQFYFNSVDNPHLDFKSKTTDGWGYCAFGKVIQGTEVVDAIASVKTMTKNGLPDCPRDTIEIISVRRK